MNAWGVWIHALMKSDCKRGSEATSPTSKTIPQVTGHGDIGDLS